MISDLKRISLGQAAFLCGLFLVLAFGLYTLTSWGVDFGWIGIVLIAAGLTASLALLDATTETGR